MSQSPYGDNIPTEVASNTSRTGPGSLNTNNKNAIKISADGVAKLTFSFLDDHHADSSLEPGEVKTPPHSPISVGIAKDLPAPKTSVVPKTLPPLHNALTARPAKSLSQLEAQACQEKVRAILELDAIKRREEADKRKLRQLEEAKMLLEQKIFSGEEEEDEEIKRKAKEERKRLKKLKKEKKAALEKLGGEEDKEKAVKKKKKKKSSREYSSEDENALGESLRPHGNLPPSVPRYAIVPAGPPPHMPPFPDQFMGFRGMNPFMRVPRPDFHHPRGGFHPRMRGGIRGVMRFPGFRPPFFGGGMQRHHNQMPRQQTPPVLRGHSPIHAPTDNLIWTTTKPSISYAFNSRDDYKSDELSNSPEEHVPSTKTDTDIISPQPSVSKHSKKSKKSREHEKIKKRRTSRNSSENSGKKKIEKVRKSPEKSEYKRTKTSDFSLLKCEQKIEELEKSEEDMHLCKRSKLNEKSDDSEEMWDDDEKSDFFNKNLGQTIKKKGSNVITFKIDTTKMSMENNLFENNEIEKLQDKPVVPEGPALPPITINKEKELKTIDNGRNFDMFADSPPRPTSSLIPNKNEDPVLKSQNLPKSDQIYSEQNTDIKKEIQSSSNIEDIPGTPPTSLLKQSSLNINLRKQSLNNSKKTDSEKTPLQRAIEIQSRIDKLLKEDDLDPLTISRIKAKSLEYKRQKEKEALLKKSQKESINNQKQTETQKTTTPDQQKLKNPFKRSNSRDHNTRRSRSRTPKRDTGAKQSSLERNRSESQSKNKINVSSSGSLNRSGSGSLNSSKTDSEKGEMTKRQEFDSKRKLSKSPPAHRSTEKMGHKGKNKQKAPLSFAATEFLFPDEDSSKSSSSKAPYDEDDTTSSEIMSSKLKKIKESEEKDDSPDTDDYMDNWENDDVDLDVNSNNTCDSSTPMRLSQDDVEDEMFMTRYTNPSPPMEVLQFRKAIEDVKPNIESLTQEPYSKYMQTSDRSVFVKEEIHQPAQKKELFGMQEIYDQFIKSVEESGVDLKSTMPSNSQDIELDKSLEVHNDKLSTSSASTSSTSSSSSSSSSEASNSSSSSSSSSSSGSSSEESNDADSFKNVQSPKRKSKVKDIIPVVIKTEKPSTPPIPETPGEESPKPLPVPKIEVSVPQQPTLPEIKPTPPASNSNQSSTGTQQPATKAAKDFKKLKSLEANLARIQLMRANYDSADEISEELLKMEKLFIQEKNLILLKYAKSTTIPTTNVNETKPPVAPIVTGQFVPSLQQTETEAEKEVPNASVAVEANKIFDANREAIKLTISPIKLPKTPAIFEKITGDDNEAESQKSTADGEEVDFTEKLQKPPKEVAIVKPMMETKDSRANQQRQRRSSPSRQLMDRSRSPGGYQRDRRRSTSRSRFSPQRRQRGRSLSVSPPHRRSGVRYSSPGRRGGATGNAFATSQSRYRNTGRRSRSRSRSISRQGNRRSGELSPPHRRSRRPVPGNQSQTHYRKSSGQQRTLRDSRSRSHSIPRSPPAPRSPLRPHSPRSPPSLRRRSYSRDRYSSRSPLPFKPPSPPMRRSLSPQRRSSLSPSKHSSSRRSRSNSRSRSPRSPRYDDHRRRRASSYDRHSPTMQRQYFDPSGGPIPSASSYYYNLSPSRISLDARINIVLNGPPNQDGAGVATYDSYSNYSQYGGQYMSIPPQPDATSYNINYSANQYVPMGSGTITHPSQSHQPVYSSIPTINSGDVGITNPFPHSNYYYNEFGAHTSAHQSTSLLKELPKATVAVQKGNVLEIVPSGEMSGGNETGSMNKPAPMKPTKVKKKTLSWKEEVNNRHVTSAVMRLSRENDGTSRSILKKSTSENIISNDDKPPKKKVYFEDGIYPNRDSDDEDRKIIDAKVRRKLKRLRKRHGITINADNLVKEPKNEDEEEVDPALENEPPPPPPPGSPPPHLEQPIYLRPPTPTPLYYFHFDPVVHSMYVSQMERPIPPRLLNPKAMVPTPGGSMVPAQSPSNMQSPNGAAGIAHMLSSKKELSTLAAINRSSRGNDRASPKLIPIAGAQRHDTVSTLKTLPIETIHPETMQNMKSSFQAIPANIISTPPPNVSQMVSLPPPRQSAPIGFMGMRINNFMRLPPSPLSRGGPIPPNGGSPMAVVGMRHSYNMPPPSMMVTAGQPHQSPSSEFSPQQQQYHTLPHPSSPHIHQPTSYPGHQMTSHHTPPPHFSTQHPPPTTHSVPPHLQHQRQPSPQLFVHSVPPPPLPAGRQAIAPTAESTSSDAVSNQSPASTPTAEETNSPHQSSSSTQALVTPYNVKK